MENIYVRLHNLIYSGEKKRASDDYTVEDLQCIDASPKSYKHFITSGEKFLSADSLEIVYQMMLNSNEIFEECLVTFERVLESYDCYPVTQSVHLIAVALNIEESYVKKVCARQSKTYEGEVNLEALSYTGSLDRLFANVTFKRDAKVRVRVKGGKISSIRGLLEYTHFEEGAEFQFIAEYTDTVDISNLLAGAVLGQNVRITLGVDYRSESIKKTDIFKGATISRTVIFN